MENENNETNGAESEARTVAFDNAGMISKLSVRGMGISPMARADGRETPLCRIFGRADGIKEGFDKVREQKWTAITGVFEGVVLESGERFQSGKLFLPPGIHETLEAAVKTLETGNTIIFALEIGSKKATNPAGYTYVAHNLKPIVVEEDPLSEIRKFINAYDSQRTPQLAAPEVSTVPPFPSTLPPAPAKPETLPTTLPPKPHDVKRR